MTDQIHLRLLRLRPSPRTNPKFVEAAATSANFGRRGPQLIYGGGSVGLMGELAVSVLDGMGGRVIRIFWSTASMCGRSQEQIITRDMHERKRIMFGRRRVRGASGGIGTLEEPVEQHLGAARPPQADPNRQYRRFWDPLCVLLDHDETSVHPRGSINLLVGARQDILPKLFRCARAIAEPEKEMAPVVAERM
jgi:predicted Rossmann-fold nucleotide-binding protein